MPTVSVVIAARWQAIVEYEAAMFTRTPEADAAAADTHHHDRYRSVPTSQPRSERRTMGGDPLPLAVLTSGLS